MLQQQRLQEECKPPTSQHQQSTNLQINEESSISDDMQKHTCIHHMSTTRNKPQLLYYMHHNDKLTRQEC